MRVGRKPLGDNREELVLKLLFRGHRGHSHIKIADMRASLLWGSPQHLL